MGSEGGNEKGVFIGMRYMEEKMTHLLIVDFGRNNELRDFVRYNTTSVERVQARNWIPLLPVQHRRSH